MTTQHNTTQHNTTQHNTTQHNTTQHNTIKSQAFTLVELIVVVTILAILGTIGFISYNGYLVGVRDSNRTTQLGELANGLELYRVKNTLPLPDKAVSVKANGAIIAYQGYMGQDQLDLIDYSKGGKDPKDQEYFTYYLTADRKKYQLLAFLEDATNQTAGVFNAAYAADYSVRFPTVTGKKLGVLTETATNLPIQTLLLSGSLDVATTTNNYTAWFSDKLSISGTGGVLFSQIYNNNLDLLKDKSLASLDSSLKGYWDMETLIQTGGTVQLKDLSNYGNNAVCYNGAWSGSCGTTGPQIVDGIAGKAMRFDGIDDYIVLTNDININPNRTIFILFRTTSSLLNKSLLSCKAGGPSGRMFGIDNGRMLYQHYDGTRGTRLQEYSRGIINDDKYNVLTYKNNTNNTMDLYINGRKDVNNVPSLGGGPLNIIGARWDGGYGGYAGGAHINGNIDEVRIYNRTLSDSEIFTLYRMRASP